ncbi:outer membrane lipoprotein chaperone LolA [Alteromonas sp. ASW11-36]|uniref:Outer-membrane lipoprotein carrier protein n=1 Tax=Alteromonas arenosi TaxID=3055817 RepID=A0ABT7SX80_9ALTE|nr:outer membrane lipoprotein chaperone LolA [Alteromonas sp. ASW11-36]MDM7860801.1 outer membrane lipoprotein chaperone LolA [Alteromonas sp. ASW11-36]
MKLIVNFCLLVSAIFAHSASATSDDAKHALQQQLAYLKGFEAQFQQTVRDVNGDLVHEAEGIITMQRPNQLHWHTTFPDEILLVADGESVWQVDYFVEQVTVVKQSSAVENNPMMLITSDDPTDWRNFSITQQDGAFQIQALTQGPIATLTLTFTDGVLSLLQSVDAQQQVSTLVFIDPQVNPEINSNKFEPQLPDGFVLDDQR